MRLNTGEIGVVTAPNPANAQCPLVSVVRNALSVVRKQQQVTVRVHPNQVKSVQENLNRIMAPYPNIKFMDVVPDLRLATGDCILESEIGMVEASVESQLEIIRKALTKSFKRRGNSVDQQLDAIERSLVQSMRKKAKRSVG